MSKIIDLGDTFIVKEHIAGAQLMTELETSNTVRVYMIGVHNGFDFNYPSKEMRNEAFANLKKEIKEND